MPRRGRPYDVVYDIFKNKGCILYTTKEEYESLKSPSYKRVNFKAKCGHDNDAVLDGFIFKDTGVICKQCTTAKVISDLQNLNLSDDHPGFQLEHKGFLLIEKILKDDFDVIKTTEGCLADVIIKPKYELSNRWIMVQMKSTHGIYKKDGYKFGFKEKSYENMIIICVSISNEKIWVFDWTRVRNSTGICIGLTEKAKYYDSEVTHDDLPNVIHDYYTKLNKYNKEYVMIPTSINQVTEYNHRLKREKEIPYLEYVYPEVGNLKVDYYINNYKIQEKVAYPYNKNNKTIYMFCMKKCVKGNDSCYDKGDNDFYWIWLRDTNEFYIIPDDTVGPMKNENSIVCSYKIFILVILEMYPLEYLKYVIF